MPKDGQRPTGKEVDVVLQYGCGVDRAIFEELVFYLYQIVDATKPATLGIHRDNYMSLWEADYSDDVYTRNGGPPPSILGQI